MADTAKWYELAGAEEDIACSTRVRLARNLQRFPFPAKADGKQKKEIERLVKEAVLSGNSILSQSFTYLPLDEISEEEAVSLVERHLASPEFISQRQDKALLLSKDESISIMVNEEDHLRIQVLLPGFSLKEAAETADRIDTLLAETLQFAYDPEFGYLTQCPTNLGTGMRASVMLHLPALTENGSMARITANLSKLGLTLRGTYGEGSQVQGAMYQLSNQITLGLSESEAVENLSAIATQLMQEERKARKAMCESLTFQDKISRAAGVLQHAKILSTGECMDLISWIRVGLSTGILSGLDQKDINGLVLSVQPATLMAREGKSLSSNERDALRAKITRGICASLKE